MSSVAGLEGMATRVTAHVRPSLRSSLAVAIAIYLILRLLLSITAASTLAAHPVQTRPDIQAQYLGLPPDQNSLLAPWQRFDTLWYQRIAIRGYRPDDGSTAFRPLYPLLIRLLAALTGNTLLAALLVSNLCFIALVMIVHALAWERFGRQAALSGTLLYVLFPAAFFLLSGYSESLFVLCCAGSLFAASRGHWGWAGVAGLLAALTRNHGGLMIVPLAVLFWRTQPRDARWPSMLWLLLPLAGLGAFPLYSSFVIHAPSALAVQAQQWGHPVSWPWQTVASYVALIRTPGWHMFNSPAGNYVEIWDLACIVIFLVLIVATARTLGLVWTLYNAFNYVVALTGLHSTSRFMLPLFPVFLALGYWMARRRLLYNALLALSLALYLFFAAQFTMWSWVA